MIKKNKWKIVVLLLVAFVLQLTNIHYDLIALHPFCMYTNSDIKVMCMNVHGTGDGFGERSLRIDSLIMAENPDLIFLTEYQDTCSMTLDSLLKIRYAYCQRGVRGNYEQTECIYSKWQIDSTIDIHIDINSSKAQMYAQESENMQNHLYHSAILKCQLRKGKKNIVIYTCHLTSNNYLKDVDSTQYCWHPFLREQEQRLRAYEYGSKVRGLEIDAICKDIENETGAVLVMGDMNDFSSSVQLQQFENMGLKNSWSDGGLGYGSTFCERWLALRIDHIYYNDKLKLTGIRRGPQGMSDHRALFGEFELVK